MKNKMFSGWSEVYRFTLQQTVTKKYRLLTVIFALVIVIAGFACNLISARNQQKSADISQIEKVYVIDESGISGTVWTECEIPENSKFPKVSFEETEEELRNLSLQIRKHEKKSVIAQITKGKEAYEVSVYLPSGSEITKDDANNFVKALKEMVHERILKESGVTGEKIAYVTGSLHTEFCSVGENAKSDTIRMLTTFFPMFLMAVLYFMVIIYGQSMGQIVSIEKSSKLMETLLLTTRPDGLILGKIIAVASIAVLQVVIWLAAAVIGFLAGNVYAKSAVYADYQNDILSVFKEIAADTSQRAFSTEAVILTVIAICLAFLFYCILAGACASFASKADELGSVMMFFHMFLIFGFLGSYALPSLVGQEWIKIIIRIIPMSAAFLLPGEILIGTLKTTETVIYLLILAMWILLIAIIAGKIYKDQIFYHGKSLRERLSFGKNRRQSEEDEKGEWVFLHDEAGRPLEKTQKIGYFFVSISPLAIFIVIQVFASFVLTNLLTRHDWKGIDLSAWETKDYVDYYHGIETMLNPLTLMVCHLLIILLFGLWMYVIRKGMDIRNISAIRSLGTKRMIGMLCVCLISGVALCFLANSVVAIENYVMPSVVEKFQKLAESSGMGISPFAIFAAVCLAPIGEELLCRGICLHYGKKAFGSFFYANIVQAVLFGVLHMNLVQGIYAFIIGLVLGVLVERYHSLLPSILVHFIVNFSSTTWIEKVLGDVTFTMPIGIGMLVLSLGITMLVLRLSRE